MHSETPREVWIAAAQGATRPRLDYPPVRVTLVAGSAFTYGVERHQIDGVLELTMGQGNEDGQKLSLPMR